MQDNVQQQQAKTKKAVFILVKYLKLKYKIKYKINVQTVIKISYQQKMKNQ